MSMYGDYIQEVVGDHIYETDQGFATYRFTDDSTVYIVDIYVVPKFRNQSVASDMAASIEEIARARGCTKMLGSVVPSNQSSAASMRVLLAYGMVPESSTNNFILFRKDL